MKNTELLNSEFNVTFETILGYSEDEFHLWCIGLRNKVVDLWDNYDLPPVVGYNDDEIISAFRKMESFPVHAEFPRKNDETKEMDVIRNNSNLTGQLNSFFPAMMKTPIGYKGDGEGKSIYDFFAKPELLETFKTYARRHFKRDSFYHYSNPIKPRDSRLPESLMKDTGLEVMLEYQHNIDYYNNIGIGLWLCPIKNIEYNGYDDKLKGQVYLKLDRSAIEMLVDHGEIVLGKKSAANVDWNRSEIYTIRFFELGQKLFPMGFKAFKISFSQYAVNFPPLTAKYLIERFTSHIKTDEKLNYYDSSAGWGGRLLGAMAVKDTQKIHYIGTDPNSDNTKRYHQVYDFYCKNVNKGGLFETPHNTIEIYCLGSEIIHENPDFQKYKGKIDFSFTSPPYFQKEMYSQEETQSWKKFPRYDFWRDGFLEPTIKTIANYLKRDRYACFNIADVKFGNDTFPLEQDSIVAFEKYGMKYQYTLKMALSPMPGGNRTTIDGAGTAKNTVRCNGMLLKYEPLLIFYKP